MNNLVKIGITFCLLFLCYPSANGQDENISFEKSESFYSGSERLQKEAITWGYLTVPENWENQGSNQIKIAVSILKNTSGIKNTDAVIFIQGGPGASGVRTIWSWLKHPIRKKHDIVLFDVRGTGFSKPRLCPDLGKELMKILAKNQSEDDDEKQKTGSVMTCRQELLNRNIDIDAYHSLSVAKDLNALKNQLGYKQWYVYGASYGTYIAQIYGNTYPEDIAGILLDSTIPDISTYYTHNTGNYTKSLAIVFDKCRQDPGCNKEYPNLENIYYKTIADLEENPITVSVDKKIIATEEFTYNAEDFKVAIQQALYHRKLIEVLPLLIYQFHDKNEAALGNLVAAFSSLLDMDYGVYYCMSCKEVLPNNDFSEFQKNATQYKGLSGGISFYKSDFAVCNKWNEVSKDTVSFHHDLSGLEHLNIPVLIFGGAYDPITPISNGEEMAKIFPDAHFIKARAYGHTPSFSRIGRIATEAFVDAPSQEPNVLAFEKAAGINFVKGIKLNAGISSMGNSLSQMNLMFLAPLVIALLLMTAFIAVFLVKIFRGKYNLLPDKVIRGSVSLTSMIGIACLVGFVLALGNVAKSNYFVLAFGLPDSYSYLFWGVLIFVALLLLTALYFIIYLKRISHRSIVFSVIFSQILCVLYFLYWGIL